MRQPCRRHFISRLHVDCRQVRLTCRIIYCAMPPRRRYAFADDDDVHTMSQQADEPTSKYTLSLFAFASRSLSFSRQRLFFALRLHPFHAELRHAFEMFYIDIGSMAHYGSPLRQARFAPATPPQMNACHAMPSGLCAAWRCRARCAMPPFFARAPHAPRYGVRQRLL